MAHPPHNLFPDIWETVDRLHGEALLRQGLPDHFLPFDNEKSQLLPELFLPEGADELDVGLRGDAVAEHCPEKRLVTEYLEHRLVGLLLAEELGGVVPVGGLVDDNVLGSGLEAVLDAAVAGDGLLVGSCVEEADVQGLRVVRVDLREEDGVGMLLGVVVVLAVAGEASEEDSLVRLVPLVYGQEDEFLLDAPDIGEGGHEGAVYHVPFLTVVLLLDSEDGEYGGSALADGVGTELREDVGFLDSPGVADALDLGHYLLDHILVVVVHAEGILYRQSATDVQGVEGRADGLQVAVDIDALAQLVPVVGVVLDAGVDEEVQHLETELLVMAELLLIEGHDVLVADTQTEV